MDHRLRGILARVRDRGEASGLSSQDLGYLGEILGDDRTDDDVAKPLWAFVQRQALLFHNIFDLEPHTYVNGLPQLLTDAGVQTPQHQQGPTLWSTPVKPSALHAAVRRNLTSSAPERRTAAATLVGLAEFEDLAPVVADALSSGREDRSDYPQQVIAAMVQALVRLAHPQATELATKYLHETDYNLKESVRGALLCADRVEADHVQRLVGADGRIDRVLRRPQALIRGVTEGVIDRDTLRHVLTNDRYNSALTMSSARVLLQTDQRDLFVELLADAQLAPALALAVAWSDADWTLEPLRTALTSSTSREAKMAMVAAISTLGGEPEAFLRSQIAMGESGRTHGAVWGALGRPALDADLRALADHDHEGIRRAVRFVLAHNQGSVDPSLSEALWLDQLRESGWWPWQIAIDAVDGVGMARPPLVELFRVLSSHPPLGDRQRLDQAIAAFRDAPWHLVRWLDPNDTDHEQRTRATLFAGVVGGPLMRATVEQRLLQEGDLHQDPLKVLTLGALGGPQSTVAAVRCRLALQEHNTTTQVQPEEQRAALALALTGQGELGARATRALAAFGAEVEEELLLLICRTDNQRDEAAEVAADIPHPRSALISDLADLLSGRTTRISDLIAPAQLVCLPSPHVRRALAERCAHPDNPLSEVMPLLLLLLTLPSDIEVEAAALAALSDHLPDASWVQQRVIGLSHRENTHWNAPDLALRIMAQAANPVYLPRIGQLLTEDNHSRIQNAQAALARINEAHPQAGVLELDVREPWQIRERYGLDENVNYEADQVSEALRLLMIGLERRSQPDAVAEAAGRRLLFTPLDGDLPPMSTRVPADRIQPMLMYLKVLFADEDTGSVVAEVDQESSGEVLTALLQSKPTAAFVVSWS